MTPSNSNRSFDFSSFENKYSKLYPHSSKPSKAFLEWFIGFTEGDGSFIVPGLQFVITQSSSVALRVQVLNYIQTNLGLGKVIQQSKSNHTHRFIVQDVSNILLICLIFNGNMVFYTKNSRPGQKKKIIALLRKSRSGGVCFATRSEKNNYKQLFFHTNLCVSVDKETAQLFFKARKNFISSLFIYEEKRQKLAETFRMTA